MGVTLMHEILSSNLSRHFPIWPRPRVRHTAPQAAPDRRPRHRNGQPRPLGLRRHLSRGRAFRSRTRRAHAERALNRAACAPPQGAEDDVERDGQCELGPGRRPRTLLLRRLKELDLQQPRIERQPLPPRALPCRVRGPSSRPWTLTRTQFLAWSKSASCRHSRELRLENSYVTQRPPLGSAGSRAQI
jgi:hypothetical protein